MFYQRILPLCTALLLLFFSGCSVVDTLMDRDDGQDAANGGADVVVVTDSTAQDTAASEAPPEGTPPAEATASAESAEEEAALEHETISSTTGRPLPEGFVYRPVLVALDNAAQSRPQTALMLADIVYEFPLDRTDHATRYLALFSDVLPERVGPVRTSRAYLAETALEWGGLYVSQGDPELAAEGYPPLAESGVRFHVENSKATADFFYRDKTITAIEEHTLFFKLRAYVEANYRIGVASDAVRFLFEHGVTYEKGKSIASVGIPFTSSDSERVLFTYDKAKNLLLRSDKNSKNVLWESKSLTPTDSVLGYENEPIAVQNLIVQFVRVSAYDSNYRSISVTGSGECMYFVNGRAVFGSWSRPTSADPTVYTLYDGSPLRLEPGTTWIMMMPGTRDIKIRYTG